MTLSVTTWGDNPQQPGIRADAYVPDQLLAGGPYKTQPIVLASGTLKRGTVVGAQTSSAITSKAGTNTGNGTIGTLSVGASPRVGVYSLVATGATTFSVTDPEGHALANATVGSAYTSTEVNFTLTAGGTAFVAGDSFALTVSDATGNYIESVKTASDGSQNPVGVLVDDADASAGPVTSGIYVFAELNGNSLIYDTSWTLATLTAAMRPYGLFVKSAVTAADPVSP